MCGMRPLLRMFGNMRKKIGKYKRVLICSIVGWAGLNVNKSAEWQFMGNELNQKEHLC